jgi:DNA-binding NarL/FixJ family response regulator
VASQRGHSFTCEKQSMTRIVTVDGSPEIAAELSGVLPRQWRMRTDNPEWVDAIVLVRPGRERVRRTRSEYPDTPILALVDHDAPVAEVVGVLEAGADACVRDNRPELVGDQLRVCSDGTMRRRSVA